MAKVILDWGHIWFRTRDQFSPGGNRPGIFQSQRNSFLMFIFGREINANVENDGLDDNGDVYISGDELEL